jgi:hypothetical protein
MIGTEKDTDPNPYLVLMDLDPDSGGPKTYGSGSATMLARVGGRGFRFRVYEDRFSV